jgi:protein-S-isoprenylcysteine O-methyltransferase Ste14
VPVRLSLRTQRLKLAWLVAVPFLWLSRPSPPLLLAGLILAIPGLILRGLASGHIEKDQVLAVDGPYACIRHPLYVGSFLVGLGLATAGGRWIFIPFFLGLFSWLYMRAIRAEERELARRFGAEYRGYRSRVPAFLPRAVPVREWDFQLRRFQKNREWEASVGVAGGLGLLWLKMVWLS